MELKSVFSIVLPIIHKYKTHNDMKKLDSLFLHDFTTFINDTLAVELAVLRHS